MHVVLAYADGLSGRTCSLHKSMESGIWTREDVGLMVQALAEVGRRTSFTDTMLKQVTTVIPSHRAYAGKECACTGRSPHWVRAYVMLLPHAVEKDGQCLMS